VLKIYHVSWACYVVITPSGKVFVWDPGLWKAVNNTDRGGVEAVVSNVLKPLNITHIDAVIISHFHSDHFEGVPYLLDALGGNVDAVYSSGVFSSGQGIGRQEDLVAENLFLQALEQYSVPHVHVASGYMWDDPDVTIECVRPLPDEVVPGTRTDNPGSRDGVSVKFSYGDFSLLLVGDRAFDEFKPWDESLQATVLQWWHHGDTQGAIPHEWWSVINPSLVVGDHGYYRDGWTATTAHEWFANQPFNLWMRMITGKTSQFLEGRRGPLCIEANSDGTFNAKRHNLFPNKLGSFGGYKLQQ
jgi:beta-lactamase superfamily II metal-dependent hydrolase